MILKKTCVNSWQLTYTKVLVNETIICNCLSFYFIIRMNVHCDCQTFDLYATKNCLWWASTFYCNHHLQPYKLTWNRIMFLNVITWIVKRGKILEIINVNENIRIYIDLLFCEFIYNNNMNGRNCQRLQTIIKCIFIWLDTFNGYKMMLTS